jgi:NAD(P)H-dependent FMN reductase
VRLCWWLVLAAASAAAAEPEVRFLCFAPSPYTHRHDALRAGAGIYLSLQDTIAQAKLPLRSTFHDGIPVYDQPAAAKALVTGAQVLVIGSSAWAQGSSYYLRRFFEHVDAEALTGTSVTAWATAGGAHTGGETVIADIFRTAMGMGAQVFSLGQKYMVFTTDERLAPPEGDFSLQDCWYMDHFARIIAVVALAGGDRAKAAELSAKLRVRPQYWNDLPRKEAELARYTSLRDRLNAARDANSEAFREIRKLLK